MLKATAFQSAVEKRGLFEYYMRPRAIMSFQQLPQALFDRSQVHEIAEGKRRTQYCHGATSQEPPTAKQATSGTQKHSPLVRIQQSFIVRSRVPVSSRKRFVSGTSRLTMI